MSDETAVSDQGTTSLVMDTLQIEVDVESHRLLYVWGYHPFQRWIAADLQLPTSTPGEVRLDLTYELQAGVSVSLGAAKDWVTHFDSGTELVRIARTQHSADMAIEIADGVIVEIDDGELTALWLRPAFES